MPRRRSPSLFRTAEGRRAASWELIEIWSGKGGSKRDCGFFLVTIPEVPEQQELGSKEHMPLLSLEVMPLFEDDPAPPEHEWGVEFTVYEHEQGNPFQLATETTAERALDRALEIVEPTLVAALERVRAAKGKSATTVKRGERKLKKK